MMNNPGQNDVTFGQAIQHYNNPAWDLLNPETKADTHQITINPDMVPHLPNSPVGGWSSIPNSVDAAGNDIPVIKGGVSATNMPGQDTTQTSTPGSVDNGHPILGGIAHAAHIGLDVLGAGANILGHMAANYPQHKLTPVIPDAPLPVANAWTQTGNVQQSYHPYTYQPSQQTNTQSTMPAYHPPAMGQDPGDYLASVGSTMDYGHAASGSTPGHVAPVSFSNSAQSVSNQDFTPRRDPFAPLNEGSASDFIPREDPFAPISRNEINYQNKTFGRVQQHPLIDINNPIGSQFPPGRNDYNAMVNRFQQQKKWLRQPEFFMYRGQAEKDINKEAEIINTIINNYRLSTPTGSLRHYPNGVKNYISWKEFAEIVNYATHATESDAQFRNVLWRIFGQLGNQPLNPFLDPKNEGLPDQYKNTGAVEEQFHHYLGGALGTDYLWGLNNPFTSGLFEHGEPFTHARFDKGRLKVPPFNQGDMNLFYATMSHQRDFYKNSPLGRYTVYPNILKLLYEKKHQL